MTDEHKIVNFPASSYLTPEKALVEATKVPWMHVLVLGYDNEEDLVFRASRMSRQDMLWIIEAFKQTLFETDDEEDEELDAS